MELTKEVWISYNGGGNRLVPRSIKPISWVSSQVKFRALCLLSNSPKYFLVDKIMKIQDHSWKIDENSIENSKTNDSNLPPSTYSSFPSNLENEEISESLIESGKSKIVVESEEIQPESLSPNSQNMKNGSKISEDSTPVLEKEIDILTEKLAISDLNKN